MAFAGIAYKFKEGLAKQRSVLPVYVIYAALEKLL
jgi:hypothetical protein